MPKGNRQNLILLPAKGLQWKNNSEEQRDPFGSLVQQSVEILPVERCSCLFFFGRVVDACEIRRTFLSGFGRISQVIDVPRIFPRCTKYGCTIIVGVGICVCPVVCGCVNHWVGKSFSSCRNPGMKNVSTWDSASPGQSSKRLKVGAAMGKQSLK